MKYKDHLKRGPWDKKELRDLKQTFPSASTEDVACLLGRPTEAVKKKASRMHLRKSRKYLKLIGHAVIVLLILCVGTQTAAAQDPNNLDPAKFTFGAIGNENQIGALVGYQPGKFTSFGLDGRWHDGIEAPEALSLSFYVSWNAVPEFELPVGGLLPQLNLPLPESIRASLNLGGSIGAICFEDEDGDYKADALDALVKIFAEAEFPISQPVTLAIRYEYAFDGDQWNQITNAVPEHQTFINLKCRF